ncbi:hypothetical protein EB796_015301 [Bugula neritina]|uniref:Uncharacterized protein n=1 Tax=Bugula neritina TaxID=10212 RepID=A0A7J7JJ80_BUGNE|nr:hypothetical protein EB796_015301 [Bugula neritina]
MVQQFIETNVIIIFLHGFPCVSVSVMDTSVSYSKYGQGKQGVEESSSSYDHGYNSQNRYYSNSVTSDAFSDISFDPYSNKLHLSAHYGYSNPHSVPDGGRRQILDVQQMPLNDGRQRMRDNSVDSDAYGGHRAPSIISSVGRDADVESITSQQTYSTSTSFATESSAFSYDQYRYHGELYKPVAAPRKVNSQVKKLFGEIHPRMLRPEEKPIEESGEETEDSVSIVSSVAPRPAPRASMRMSRRSIEFIEDEAIRFENSLLKSILRSAVMSARRDAKGNKMIVRFEHVDKYADSKPRRDITDYSDIDSDHGKNSKKHKTKQKDVWSHVAPVGPKPARNSRSNSHRSSSRRSSSADRSRQTSRSGSKRRSSSASSISRRSHRSSVKTNRHSHSDSKPGVTANGGVKYLYKCLEKERSRKACLVT